MLRRGEGGIVQVDLGAEQGVLRIVLQKGLVEGAAFSPGDIVRIQLEDGFRLAGDEAASWDDFVGYVIEGEIEFQFEHGIETVRAGRAFWVDPPSSVSSPGARIVGTRAKTPGG